MNTGDPTRLMKRISGILGQVISARADNGVRSFGQRLPSLQAPFCWALILGVLLFMVSGCGKYKEELETAKQQIENLNSEVKKLTDDVARLSQEKNRLSDESRTLSDKNTRMQRDLDDLNRAKTTLTAENKDMKQRNSAAEQEIASLKKEKADSAKQIEELKNRVAELVSPPKPSVAMPAETAKKPEELSPCDAVIAFMKASEGIIRQQRGKERTKLLEQVKQQYAARMKGAPEKAIRAAENWVKEGAKLWDQSHEEGVFRLIRQRNIVLEACGKSPEAAGF